MGELSDYVHDFHENWRESDLPIPRRALRTMRNLTARLRGKGCCGRLGEPGC